MENEKMLKIINELVRSIKPVPGTCTSYNEGGSDFYNPIQAGMDFQRIKDKIHELIEILPIEIDKSNRSFLTIYKLKMEE